MGFKRIFPAFFLLFSLFGFQVHLYAEEFVRKADVAGGFYPADRGKLETLLDQYLSLAPKPEDGSSPSDITLLVVPHAGYVFSGQTAAYAYRAVNGRAFDVVVLLGPYHKGLFRGASVWPSGFWETPLGRVAVDADTASIIRNADSDFQMTHAIHGGEHSLEIQLPFLQKGIPDLKIVPILVSDPSASNTGKLARAVVQAVQGRKALILASTDMSHYHDGQKAERMDGAAINHIREADSEGLRQKLSEGSSELCGSAAVLTLLDIAKLLDQRSARLLRHSHSGDVTGDFSNVVGYGAFLFEKKAAPNAVATSGEDRRRLLEIARSVLEEFVTTGKTPEITEADPDLLQIRSAFVTLRKSGQLRGCIGSLHATQPLYREVRDRTVEAASRDPRFSPLRPDELGAVDIEISVLSPPEKVSGADAVDLGKHGVVIRRGASGGVFLPKVAEETGWSKEQFLSELCTQKAGLEADCWKSPATELYVFTAEDFGEKRD